ncbi:Cellulose synthase [Macleaya cordata]|uniref:Cellulose synthase n=1 Tax=Macleaya cordata TaxID=56857 RepID=A0A200PYU7_MACCD|nr:Cellulose synthase [Macleaya cordata]
MAMAMAISLPLQERIPRKNTLKRAFELIIFFLLVSLLIYRLKSLEHHGLSTWLFAFICESWFTFVWVLYINAKWNPVEYKTYPDRLLERIDKEELPPVDLFVTTADAALEPPIITVNTVLSMLSLDYPTHKLACYVSDDGASPVTFYALIEASKFAKLWVPFCKKYKIQVRAPFLYFSAVNKPAAETSTDLSSNFRQDWINMKNEYEVLCERIENAVQNSVPCEDLAGDFTAFAKIERGNHPSIVKVIWENKEDIPDGLPHLVYVSREKRPKHPHHFKAGAMNVLTRISGVMTNAPFMLNVDCDMFANNPQIVLHAMCLLLGTKKEKESGFVQCPQYFYGSPKDDPFGNQLIVLQEYLGRGLVGIQGPFYGGTGCFHRRKVIYGLLPDHDKEINKANNFNLLNGKSSEEILQSRFGYSKNFVKSAAHILSGTNENSARGRSDLSGSIDATAQVADCSYESNTDWGTNVGWVYGSTTEDVLTGLRIHSKGWASVYCTPDPLSFLGCAPTSGPGCVTQMKRWSTGLLEILFSNYSPIFCTINGHLRFRQCLVYILINVWGLRSIPELCYAALPAYCLLTNTSFIPSVTEPAILIPGFIFVVYNLYTLSEYLHCGLSARSWWNNQRMLRINSASAWLFGVLSIVLKLLGLSETVFEVTKKDQNTSKDEDTNEDAGKFTFDESPIFIPGTALVLVHLTAIVVSMVRYLLLKSTSVLVQGQSEPGSGLGEIVCSGWVVLSFFPFVKGLYRKGNYGIPTSVICKAAGLAAMFVQFCKWASRD